MIFFDLYLKMENQKSPVSYIIKVLDFFSQGLFFEETAYVKALFTSNARV